MPPKTKYASSLADRLKVKKEKPLSYFRDIVDEYYYRHQHKAMDLKYSKGQLAAWLHSHQTTDVEVAVLFFDAMKSS